MQKHRKKERYKEIRKKDTGMKESSVELFNILLPHSPLYGSQHISL